MKQVFSLLAGTTVSAGTWYVGLTSHYLSSSEAGTFTIWPSSGNFRNLIVKLAVAPGEGKSRTIALRINGSEVASVTINHPDTEGQLTGSDYAITAGQKITLGFTSSVAAVSSKISYSIEFEGSTSGESAYSFMSGTGISASATRWNGVFAGNYWTAGTSATMANVVPIAGTITGFRCEHRFAPGTGKSFAFTIYKNGVKQDGSGGTTNTTVTLSGTAVAASGTFSLAVSAGDLVTLECVPSGTPTASSGAYGFTFVSTAADKSIICCGREDYSEFHDTRYRSIGSFDRSTDESTIHTPGGINTFYLHDFTAVLTSAEGTGKSRTFTLRKNSNTPAGAPTITISGASQTTGSDSSNTVTIEEGDTVDIMSTRDSTSVTNYLALALAQTYGTPPAPSATFPALTVAI